MKQRKHDEQKKSISTADGICDQSERGMSEKFDRETVDFILGSKIFIDFSYGDFEHLCENITEFPEKRHRKGETILSEGDMIGYIALILSGEVEVSRLLANGEFFLINKLGRRNTIGIDTAYKVGHTSDYFYKAVTDVDFFRIPLSDILEPGQIEENLRNRLVTNIAIILTQENLRINTHLNILSEKGLRKRIYLYLSDKKRTSGSDSFTIPYNREEMASFLCVNRSALSKELAKMKDDGILEYYRNRFRLLK
ncbi:MAG: Crp/Fnr family transcriptional regulator [Clostridiales bacterium]|nr:Crp/Fnr family transcriptional regulator [Clostridiales bacterium]